MAVRILLVEDDPFDRELACRALAQLPEPLGPPAIVPVVSWHEATARLEDGFDLVLLDFHLPDRTGLAALDVLGPSPRVPVVMLTGQNDLETAVETLRRGAREYVAKSGGPGWASVLCLTVERVLARVKLEQSLAAAQARLAARAAELEHLVTERTKTIEHQAREIEALFLKSEAALRAKADILANVSHELRTPLNIIVGYAELLTDCDPGDAAAALDHITTQARHLTGLVQSLVDLGQLRAGAVGLELSSFDLASLARELQTDATLLVGSKPLTVAWNVTGAKGEIVCDREKLRVIANHLLGNAIKFTAEGMVQVFLGRGAYGGAVLAVGDTGIGIDPAAAATLCEDFRQADASSTRPYEGLGLGLGIVKRYVSLLGGTLRFTSEPGRGTVVVVELPSCASESRQARDAKPMA